MTMQSTARWSNAALLRAIPNPAQQLQYTTQIVAPEVTFLGAKKQPDFATLTISYVADATVIELKSLKEYLHDFRNRLLSYERLTTVVFDDLTRVYAPRQLQLSIRFRPRGGLSSYLVIDSLQQLAVIKEEM